MKKTLLLMSCCLVFVLLGQAQASDFKKTTKVYGLEQANKVSSQTSGQFILQVASFTKRANALRYKNELTQKMKTPVHLVIKPGNPTLYRLIIGPFANTQELKKVSLRLSTNKNKRIAFKKTTKVPKTLKFAQLDTNNKTLTDINGKNAGYIIPKPIKINLKLKPKRENSSFVAPFTLADRLIPAPAPMPSSQQSVQEPTQFKKIELFYQSHIPAYTDKSSIELTGYNSYIPPLFNQSYIPPLNLLLEANGNILITNPEFPEIPVQEATAAAALKHGKINALALYRQVAFNNPNDKAAEIGLIQTYIRRRKFSQAKEELARYKLKFGEDARYKAESVRYQAGTGQTTEAINQINAMLQSNPTSDYLLDVLDYALSQETLYAADVPPPTVTAPKMVRVGLIQTCAVTGTCPQIAAVTPPPAAVASTTKPAAPAVPAEPEKKPEEPKLVTGFVEGGMEHDLVTNRYGNWFNQYIKGFAQLNEKEGLFGEFWHGHEFRQSGDYAKVEYTYNYNDDVYGNYSAGISDNSIFVPKYYLGTSINVKQLKDRRLVLYLGAHAYWWRPIYSSEDINPGFVYYFKKPWVLEAGAYINRTNPGVIYTTSGYVALTQGKEKQHFVTVRLGWGREGYLPLGGVAGGAAVGYASQVITVTWRQWLNKKWGMNVIGEHYNNKFYQRTGVTVGVFRDFSI